MTALLELRNVSRRFGGLRAVDDLSLTINRGHIVGLLGPNGAGKTTVVNLISGALRPTSGEIWFKGSRIDRLPVHRISRMGVSRTFQIVQPFPEMTALENVAAAALFAGSARNPAEAAAEAARQLDRVRLSSVADAPAFSLSLGQRKRLEFAKSLATKPDLLLLDEVNAGLHGGELAEAVELIREIAAQGITIVMIEHLMKVVLPLCSEIAVLHRGRLVRHDIAAEVVKDPEVIKAYLGERYAQRQAEAQA